MKIRVEVEGVPVVLAALETFKVKASDLKDAWSRIGSAIAADAKVNTPVLTGRLVKTIRAGRAKSKAVVRAGNNKMVYAPIQHYGWPGHNIEAKPFLTTALAANEPTAVREVETELGRLITGLGLN